MTADEQKSPHRHTKEQLRLGERLLTSAFHGGPDDLTAVYHDSGLDEEYTERADLLILMAWVSRVALNFHMLRSRRVTRSEEERDAILSLALNSPLGEVTERVRASDLLDWACKRTEEPPEFIIDDTTAFTYISVAAAALRYTVGPVDYSWKKRYRVISRAARRRHGVRAEHRTPQE